MLSKGNSKIEYRIKEKQKLSLSNCVKVIHKTFRKLIKNNYIFNLINF